MASANFFTILTHINEILTLVNEAETELSQNPSQDQLTNLSNEITTVAPHLGLNLPSGFTPQTIQTFLTAGFAAIAPKT